MQLSQPRAGITAFRDGRALAHAGPCAGTDTPYLMRGLVVWDGTPTCGDVKFDRARHVISAVHSAFSASYRKSVASE
jgi:hypothetical protein